MYDEPFADSSQIPTYLVSQMARRHVTVALSGDGGDEVFGGYNRYLDVDRVARWQGLPRPLRRALAAAMQAIPYRAVDAMGEYLGRRAAGDKLHKLARVFDAADRADIYRRLVCHWHDADDVVLACEGSDDLPRRPGEWPELENFTAQMMYLDTLTYLPDDNLTKLDRASMAVGLEARVPMIDHRVVAFAWSLPHAMKFGGGVSKRLLRKLLYRHVPAALIERPKMGFSIPLHDWLRGPLRDWAEALLARERLQREGFFDPDPIRKIWTDHLAGTRNWQHHLWCVLSFQAWHEAHGR